MADPAAAVKSKEIKHSKIPLFYGLGEGKDEVSAVDLIDRIEALCKTSGKNTDEAKCNELYLALRGDAVTWYKSLKSLQIDNTTWKPMKDRFTKDYDFRIPGQVAYKLDVLKQKPTEKVIDFFARVDVAIENFYENFPKRTDKIAEETRYYFQLGIFIGGLKEEIKSKLLENNDKVKTLLTARDFAQKIEFILATRGKTISSAASSIYALEEFRKTIEEDADFAAEGDEESAILEEDAIALMNRYKKHLVRRNFQGKRTPRSHTDSPFSGKCYNCGLTGHLSRNCRKPRKAGVHALDEPFSGEEADDDKPNMLAPIKNW